MEGVSTAPCSCNLVPFSVNILDSAYESIFSIVDVFLLVGTTKIATNGERYCLNQRRWRGTKNIRRLSLHCHINVQSEL